MFVDSELTSSQLKRKSQKMSDDQSIPPPPTDDLPTTFVIPAPILLPPPIDTTPIAPTFIPPAKRVKRTAEEQRAHKAEYDKKYRSTHYFTAGMKNALIDENTQLRAQVNGLKSVVRTQGDQIKGLELQLKSVNAYSLMLTESKLKQEEQEKVISELKTVIAQKTGL